MISSSGGRMAKAIAITSGKGGVGKTNVVVNLGLEFARRGNRVLIIDADLGLANVDILLGIHPEYSLQDVLSTQVPIEQVLVEAAPRLSVLPASSGVQELTHLTAEQKLCLLSAIESVEENFDLILVDTGAGISENVLDFNAAAQEILVVITTEPTSLTDAYAIIKVLYQKRKMQSFRILVNQVKSASEARATFAKLSTVADNFLNVGLDYLGYVFHDEHVSKAVRARRPLVVAYPESPAARCLVDLADVLQQTGATVRPGGSAQFFWRKLLQAESA